MLQKIREHLALLLILLLPFHALAVTVVTKLIAGPNHAPLSSLALWKEGLLALILLFAFIEIVASLRKRPIKIDLIDWMIIGLVVLAMVIHFPTHYSLLTTNYLLGFKYDLIPLIAFLVLRRVPWSDWFKARVIHSLLIVGIIVAAYGILTLILPDSFFTALGYSSLHSLYIPDGPLAAFQQIGGSALHRIQSTMSGPNQLGLWLLIPLAFSFQLSAFRKNKTTHYSLLTTHAISLFLLLAILLTFSRASWIGAFIIVASALFPVLQRMMSVQNIARLILGVIAVAIIAAFAFPSVILRSASSRDHVARPLQAIQQMLAHPFGTGLGTAGPATNRTGDACVYLEAGADASWAKDQPNLCVFVGESQVQPSSPCNCPFLPENWYLQIGVELGWLGMFLFIGLVVMLPKKLGVRDSELGMKPSQQFRISHSAFLIFLSISIAALFLHAWEDSAVAYTVWMLVAISLPIAQRKGNA